MSRPATVESLGTWSQWTHPVALYDSASGKTIAGFAKSGGTGGAVAWSYDHSTNEVDTFTLKALTADDHTAPAFRVRADGKIQAFYLNHTGSTIYHRLTSSAGDISAWAAEQSETPTSGSYSYPQPIDLTAKLVLHYRFGISSSATWEFIESADDGVTFGAKKVMLDGGGFISPYVAVRKHPTDNRIDYAANNGQPQLNGNISLYHFYREGDSFYESDGTLITTLGDLSNLPADAMTFADLTQIVDGSSVSAWSRVWDIAHDASGNPRILFARGTGSTAHDMYETRWNGSAWTSPVKIADVGDTIDSSREHYSAGACLDPDDEDAAYIAVESGGAAEIRKYTTADDGATWSVDSTITDDYWLNARPVVPVDRQAGCNVMWWRLLEYVSPSSPRGSIVALPSTAPSVGAGTVAISSGGEVFTGVANSADDAFDLADWEQQANCSTLAVDGDTGALAHDANTSSNWGYVRCSASTDRGERMVQVYQSSTGGNRWVMAGGHFETGSGGNQIAGSMNSVLRGTENFRAIERTGNTLNDSDAVVIAARENNIPYRRTVYLNGTAVSAYDETDDESSSITAPTYSTGWSGVGANNTDNVNTLEFFDCTGKDLTCSGMDTGHKLQVRNMLGVVLKEATESSGTATIDMLTVAIPEVASIVVVDAVDALQGGLTLAGTGGPKEYARGGDAYSYTAPVDDPSITETVEFGEDLTTAWAEIPYTDAIAFTDAVVGGTEAGDNTRSVSDFIAFGENFTTVWAQPSFADSFTLSDAAGGTSIVIQQGDLTERIRFNEDFTVAWTQCTDADGIIFTDATASGVDSLGALIDGLTLSDVTAGVVQIGSTGFSEFMLEEMTFSDAFADGVFLGVASQAERLLLSDDPEFAGGFLDSLSDGLVFTDSPSYPITFIISQNSRLIANYRKARVAANRL